MGVWRRGAKRTLRRAGLRVVHHYDADQDAQRHLLLGHHGITTVLDVGANTGQYGRLIRQESGYSGRIVSFEPGDAAFTALSAAAEPDPRWDVHQYGLSDMATSATLLVPPGASTLASLSPMSERGAEWSDQFTSRPISEPIELRRLDESLDHVGVECGPILLKLDVQGHEQAVLEGAAGILNRIQVIECEMALTPMYDQQLTLTEMLSAFTSRGFEPVGIYTHFIEETSGEAFDADVLLVRRQ